MRLRGTEYELSATDLSNFLGCRHRTALDMAAAQGTRARPPKYVDPLLELLWKRGLEHERQYVESLQASGRTITDLSDIPLNAPDDLVAATLDAIRAGADVIVQGGLRDGSWFGKPDILRRIPTPSALGDWSYEVIDTKLAKETRAGTILQLGLYSEMVGLIQGVRPEHFYVVTPDKVPPTNTYRLDDFAAYFRLIRRQMLATVDLDSAEVAELYYPDPVEACEICRWQRDCDQQRREDDHLCLVAGISRVQRRELESRDVDTLTQLAGLALPLAFKPRRGSIETYVRVREQARLQLESRGQAVPLFELRAISEEKDEGLCRLPAPSPGDIFLDLEGDPFAAEGGREYLFGLVTVTPHGTLEYRSFWGFSEKEERDSFEQVIDLIGAARQAHPEMHVYHYAPYEPSAFKRLMGRYATRGNELDDLLRNAVFVDLYGVIRQGVLVGTERYSIKNMEPLYGFEREVRLADANRCLRVMEQALEMSAPETVPPEVRDAVEGYNRDDCVSTLKLRDWLERVREEHIASGTDVPRPRPPEVKVVELKEREIEVEALRKRLLEGLPLLRAERNEEQQARWLLAYLLDYHRREEKATWWEYFRLLELPEEDLFDEPQAIAGMKYVERVGITKNVKTGKPTGSVTDRYSYPPQEMEIDKGNLKLRNQERFGKVAQVDRTARFIDVLKGPSQAEHHPISVFEHTIYGTDAQQDSIQGIAGRMLEDAGVAHSEHDAAGRALLQVLDPTLRSGRLQAAPDDATLDHLITTVSSLADCVLPVQGPPGSGKTFAGAATICALVAAGKRVGIAGPSHKVIRNLLDAVGKAALKAGKPVSLGQRIDDDDHVAGEHSVSQLCDNEEAADALRDRTVQVAGGTSWLWSSEHLIGSVDVLFVDEAGQMSLANVLAMSPAARSVVLLGDPQQLEQPRKGTHPDGVGISALEHMLAGSKTIAADRGVFLPVTWRLCPALAQFTSEVFYEGRLSSKPGLELQRLNGTDGFDGNGLWVIRAKEDGNRTSSVEEIELVAGLVERLARAGAEWVDGDGLGHLMAGSDILVVAPYNAQVSRLAERLKGTGARVGTVDKFQGQEAPVVIYSMATSRPEDAPRGMEFLYSGNRLNVATSRAKCVAIIVANERLFEPECRTPRQMKLANGLCRFTELAK